MTLRAQARHPDSKFSTQKKNLKKKKKKLRTEMALASEHKPGKDQDPRLWALP